MQQFQTGKAKLQKADLEQMLQQTTGTQSQSQTQKANPFDSMLSAFDEIDKNQDGISIDELESYASENGMVQGTGRPPGPPPGPPPSMMSELGPKQGGAGKMSESVSKEELLNIKTQMESESMDVPEQLSNMISNFDSLDTNQDGKVSIDEMLAAQEDTSSEKTDTVGAQKLDFLKLIEKYANEYSAESTSESTSDTSSDASKDLAIKFMHAMKQYNNFSSYSNQDMTSSLFKLDA